MNEVKENGWQQASAKTTATVTRSYTQNGEHCTESETLIGTPENVRRKCMAKYPGEATKIEDVHTIRKVWREMREETTDGTIKQRQERTIQSDDFGDGTRVNNASNPSEDDDDDEEYDPDEEPTNEEKKYPALNKGETFLKNFYDGLRDRVDKHISDQGWFNIGLAMVGITALVISVFALSR